MESGDLRPGFPFCKLRPVFVSMRAKCSRAWGSGLAISVLVLFPMEMLARRMALNLALRAVPLKAGSNHASGVISAIGLNQLQSRPGRD